MLKKLITYTIFVTMIFFIYFVPLTQAQDPIKFIVTDLEGIEEVQREFGPFRDLLQDKTGLTIKFYPVTSRTAAVEAVKSKKADFVLTGPAEYVVMRKMTTGSVCQRHRYLIEKKRGSDGFRPRLRHRTARLITGGVRF